MKYLILPLLIIINFGCSKKQTQNPNTLYVVLGSQPSTLDPRFATDAYGMRLCELIYSSLVRVGPDLKVVADAAESWSFKNNEFIFSIRPGLKFSNGRNVTSEDILFSFQEYRKPDSPFNTNLSSIENIDVAEKDSKVQVKIKLKTPNAKFLISDLPIVKILPKKELQNPSLDLNKTSLGSGSYALVQKSSNEIQLKSNTFNKHNVPKTENLSFKVIRDEFTRYQKLLKGSVDIAQTEIPLSKIKEFEGKDNFKVFKYMGLSTTYLLINLKHPLLKKSKLRQALAHSINRDEIIKYKLENLASPAVSIVTPKNPFHYSQLKMPNYDFEKAKSIIKELGLSGEALELKTSNAQSAVDNGKILAYQMNQAGLKVELKSYEWGTFYGDIKKGRFQLATMRWVGISDPDIYRLAFHSLETPPGRNRGSYSNKAFDQLVDDGLKIMDFEKRYKHYIEVQKIVLNDLPIIPLWYDLQVAIINKNVQNFTPSVRGDFSPLLKVTKVNGK